MKKLFLVLTMVAGFGLFSLMAQETVVKNEIAQQQEIEYTTVDVKELPPQVTKEIAEKHALYTIKEAYKAATPEGVSYKIILVDGQGVEKEVVIQLKGESETGESLLF